MVKPVVQLQTEICLISHTIADEEMKKLRGWIQNRCVVLHCKMINSGDEFWQRGPWKNCLVNYVCSSCCCNTAAFIGVALLDTAEASQASGVAGTTAPVSLSGVGPSLVDG